MHPPRMLRPRMRRRGPAAGAVAPEAGAPAQPEVMEIVKDTFGDWQVRCAPTETTASCTSSRWTRAKNPVAEVSILKLPEQSEADAARPW